MTDWQETLKIWEGLNNFRQLRRDVARMGIEHIDQDLLDKLYIGQSFTLEFLPTKQLSKDLEKQADQAYSRELGQELEFHRIELERVEEDLIVTRSTDNFNYEFVFKEEEHNIKGFVKVFAKDNPTHIGLLTWQEGSNDPILYLAELENSHIRFHINYGSKDGLALIQEIDSNYTWTHTTQCEYPDILNAEYGTAIMNKKTQQIELQEANLAAIEAAQKASTIGNNGKTLFENNIKLMELYKADLNKLRELNT